MVYLKYRWSDNVFQSSGVRDRGEEGFLFLEHVAAKYGQLPGVIIVRARGSMSSNFIDLFIIHDVLMMTISII